MRRTRLRARLAEREDRAAEKVAALHRAHDCYTRFGMTVQATRVAKELNEPMKNAPYLSL